MSLLTRREVLAAGATGLAALAGCLGPSRSFPERPSGEWHHRAHDARNSAGAEASVPPRATPAWDTGEDGVTPLVSDGTVYTFGEEVLALDAKDGSERWTAELPAAPEYAAALVENRLVVGAGDRLVAIDSGTGKQLWSTGTSGPVTGAVTASSGPGVAVVPVADQRLLAVDPATGDERWQDSTYVPTQAAVANGTVYVVGHRRDSEGGVVRAISAADGTREWATSLDSPDTRPVVAEAGVLVGDAGTVTLLDRSSGERVRDLGTFGDQVPIQPAVADATAYVGGDGLTAVSVADGTVEWSVDDVNVSGDAGVTAGADAVVAASTNLPGVVAFDRTDGSRRWEHAVEGFDAVVTTVPVLADGAVFYASNESLGVVALGDLPTPTGT